MSTSDSTTLRDILESSYSRFRDQIAVSDARGQLTYGELGERVARISSHLARLGLAKGDRVGTVMGNRSEYLQIEQAMAFGGFVRVAAIPRLHPHEVSQIFLDAEPSIIFIENEWLHNVNDDLLRNLNCPVVVLEETEGRGFLPFASFLEQAPSDIAPPTLEDPAWIAYTSGTTGKPKGVVHAHRSLSSAVRNMVTALLPLTTSDVAIHTAPWPHMSGIFGWAVTATGGHNALLDSFEPEELCETIQRLRGSVIPLVPTQLNRLTEYIAEYVPDISSVRVLPYAGSAIAPDRLAQATRYFGASLVQLYGLAEILMPIAVLQPLDHVPDINAVGLARFASAGRTGPDTEIDIRDDDNASAPMGTPGEIMVRSARATVGYWRQPELTAELFDADGFCHTGDVGLVDDDGYLFIVDRKKDMIVSGGFNVYPREVENALSTMPEVQEVAVVSAPDERWGETIVAVIVVRTGEEVSLESVQEHCRQVLANYKVPRRLEVVEEIPKGSTGKPNKRALSDRLWAGAVRRVGG